MISLTVDWVIAIGQFLAASVRANKPFWRAFRAVDAMGGGGKMIARRTTARLRHRCCDQFFGGPRHESSA
jgi:hypothetical protein